MATRAKDTAPPGKEKRGASPSYPIPHHMRSPNSSTTNSPVRKRADSTISNKTVPNYLKPTVSYISLQLVLRHKAANPKERILGSSSSFSGKSSSTSQKPLSDRLSRISHMTKDATGKQHGTGTDDHNGSTSNVSITNSSRGVEDVIPQAETGQDDMHNLRSEQDRHDDSTPKVSVITDSLHATEKVIPQAELSEQEDNQELPVTDTESDVIINSSGTIDTATGEDNSAIEDQEEHNGNVNNGEIVAENQEVFKMEEPEEEQLVEVTSTSNPKEPEEITAALNEDHPEENTVKIADENQQEKEEHEGRNQGKEPVIAEESEAVEKINTTAASSKHQRQVVQGKKESMVSNDVIEETASKPREQRKNRVKALAGAFETVISLQEPK
ncbi:unnamed protein product [Withania somnifera]